jgi:APA family basic amino acid/polyamine antiporter
MEDARPAESGTVGHEQPGETGAAHEAGDVLAPGTRGFGTATATFIVVASMVGTGVLTTSGYTVLSVESNALMLALWVVGGLIALCGALSLAELSAAIPRTGGDYVFLYQSYGPLAAFLSGWVSFLIGFGGPIAVSAFGSAKYLLAPLELTGSTSHYAQLGLATAAILALAVSHASGRRHSAWVQGVTTVVKLGVLGLLAAAGLVAAMGRRGNLADWPTTMSADRVRMMFFSLVYISYAYTGWNAAGYVAGEVEEPRKRVPRAILVGTGLVTALYLALNLFYALALPAEKVSAIAEDRGRDEIAKIAQLASAELFGEGLSAPLSVAIGLTLLASASAFILTGPRIAFAMARAGQFPAIAGRLSPRAGTPTVAIALQVAWAMLLLWTGSFEDILIYASVGLAIISMLTVSCVYVLRVRRPDLPRPFKTPGYPVTPAVYLLATALLTAAAFTERPRESSLALASILAGVPVYYLVLRKGAAKNATGEPEL